MLTPRYIYAENMQSLLEEEIEGCGNPTAEDNPIAYGATLGLKMALSYTKTLPNADVAPVVHAHWIKHDKTLAVSFGASVVVGHYFECSSCGRTEDHEETYCNCGAKMGEEVGKNG